MRKTRILVLALALVMVVSVALVCSSCRSGKTDKESASGDKKNTGESTVDKITGTVPDSMTESAHTDAINSLTALMTYQAEDGVAVVDNGIVFAVTKGATVYYFVHTDGELTQTDTVPNGADITPSGETTWLSNVKVFMP